MMLNMALVIFRRVSLFPQGMTDRATLLPSMVNTDPGPFVHRNIHSLIYGSRDVFIQRTLALLRINQLHLAIQPPKPTLTAHPPPSPKPPETYARLYRLSELQRIFPSLPTGLPLPKCQHSSHFQTNCCSTSSPLCAKSPAGQWRLIQFPPNLIRFRKYNS